MVKDPLIYVIDEESRVAIILELPSRIESSKATADHRNGILEVRIPKSKD